MKNSAIATLLILAAPMTLHGQSLDSASTPKSTPLTAGGGQMFLVGPSDELKSRLRGFFLPVIMMEKHHGHRPYLSRYRIEIYKNGRGYYYGLRDVKTLGEISFQLSEQQIDDLLIQIEKLDFWKPEVTSEIRTSPETRLRYEFLIRDDVREKQWFSYGGSQASAIHKSIEDVVGSFRWRCPYVNAVLGEDLCKSELEYIEQDASRFQGQSSPSGTTFF